MNKHKLIENYESIAYSKMKDFYQIPISGWNIKNPEELIKNLMEEYFDYPKDLKIEILAKHERAYSCSRYDCGVDANDDGYSFYINYHREWKKGLGKCTIFNVKFANAVEDESIGK